MPQQLEQGEFGTFQALRCLVSGGLGPLCYTSRIAFREPAYALTSNIISDNTPFIRRGDDGTRQHHQLPPRLHGQPIRYTSGCAGGQACGVQMQSGSQQLSTSPRAPSNVSGNHSGTGLGTGLAPVFRCKHHSQCCGALMLVLYDRSRRILGSEYRHDR